MTDFTLHPGLARTAHVLADWPLCRVLLCDDSRYHWGLLVPRRADVTEICDLSREDQNQLMTEIVRLSDLIRALPGVTKLNVANLGNIVPQLHVHVIGRAPGDVAWPGPVWGHSDPVPWPDPMLAPLCQAVSKG